MKDTNGLLQSHLLYTASKIYARYYLRAAEVPIPWQYGDLHWRIATVSSTLVDPWRIMELQLVLPGFENGGAHPVLAHNCNGAFSLLLHSSLVTCQKCHNRGKILRIKLLKETYLHRTSNYASHPMSPWSPTVPFSNHFNFRSHYGCPHVYFSLN